MEGYAHRSRSRVRAPQPPFAGAAAFSSKKSHTNGGGGTVSANGFTACDDVFGGPLKFSVAPFAPRAEDYSEIFGSSLSSRASSIPMLDLPPVDDSVAAFDVHGAGCDYSDVFGGLEFFAVPYDKLFGQSDCGEESSDEAWTPAGTESVSEESDLSAGSERNQCFLNEDFHQSLESKQFNVSYHKVNTGAREVPNVTCVAPFSAVPGYTHVVDGSISLQKEDGARHSSGAIDDIILSEDSSGNISVETLGKNSSFISHDCASKQLYECDKKAGRVNGACDYSLDPTVVSVSDIGGRSKSSQLAEPSSPRHKPVDGLGDRANLTPDCDNSKSCAYERISESGSPQFFDVEVHVSPSALASVTAMQEAMQRAQVKLKNAKELMDRKKDSLNGTKPGPKNEINREVKARMSFDESMMRSDVLQSTYQVEHGEARNPGKGNFDSSETMQLPHDSLRAERASGATLRSSQQKTVKNHTSSLNPASVEGEGEWKEASQYFELINNGNFRAEPESLDNSNKLEQEFNSYHFVDGNGKPVALKQQDGADGITGAANHSLEGEGDEESELSEEELEPRENRRRFRSVKVASRQEFHEKMVKVALEVHERVMCDSVDIEKKLKEVWEGDGSDRKLEMRSHGVKNKKTLEHAAQQSGSERKHDEFPSKVGTEIKSEEPFLLAESAKKEKEICMGIENEKSLKEARPREDNGMRMKVGPATDENGRRVKEAHQCHENKENCTSKEKRKKEEGCLRDESTVNNSFQLKEDRGKAGRGELHEGSKSLEEADNEEWRVDEEVPPEKDRKEPKEVQKMGQHVENIEEAAVADAFDEKPEHSVDLEESKNHEVPLVHEHATENEMLEVPHKLNINKSEYDVSNEETMNASELDKTKVCGNADKKTEQQEECRNDVQIDLENNAEESDSHSRVKMHVEAEHFTSMGASSSGDDKNAKLPQMACKCEDFESSNSATPDVKDMSKPEVVCECEEQTSSYAAPKMCEDKQSGDCRTQPLVVDNELKAAEMADSSTSTDHVHEAAAPQPMMPERKEPIQKRPQPVSTSQRAGQEGLAANGNLTAEDREKAEMLKRVRELEEERLRKLEEESERKREREKDRMGVELGMGERAFAEAHDRAERAAVERATAEARQRAVAEARERLEKACAEARGKSLQEKASAEVARLRAERAAVEGATAEARERAIEKAKAERVTYEVRERFERSGSDKFSGMRHSSLSSDLRNNDKLDGVEGETAERCRARLERHRRTVERVAKALAEKNMRDLIVQREQAERNRFAKVLDADIKRWSSGKEGNLRALLSTLQYILGPDSGWHPIPLTEVITSAAVKKAYRKATLCVHPDKLQQRGATIQQKYICEKVFDLLKDAWNKFNSEEI